MKKRRVMKIIFILLVAALILLLIMYINHQIRLKEEADLRVPLGQMVEIDGHNMCIHVEGTGDTTLVFMSGGGTCSPILDSQSLYSLLSDNYQIAVVEKFGYGFSDIIDKDRDPVGVIRYHSPILGSGIISGLFVTLPIKRLMKKIAPVINTIIIRKTIKITFKAFFILINILLLFQTFC